MVNWHYAYSAPVNPPDLPSSEPVLTVEQCWKALQRKVRHAEEFVPVITKCEVLEDKDNVVVREVEFGGSDGGRKRETIHSFEPAWVDFHQPNGSIIRNTLSHGPTHMDDGNQRDLVMTYSFEFRLPEMQKGSKEYEDFVLEHEKMAQMAVTSSIRTARKMAKEGRV